MVDRRRRQPGPGLPVLPVPTTWRSACRRSARCTRWKPDDDVKPAPDLATAPAAGVRRRQDADDQDQARHQVQPAAADRTVKAADIKYAIERCVPAAGRQRLRRRLLLATSSGRQGLPGRQGRRDLRHHGAATTRRSMIKLEQPVGVLATGDALALPAHGAGAEGLRRRSTTRASTSTYGEHQVFTGPYMIPNDASGKLDRLHAGQALIARAQPELGPEDRLPARLPRQDHHHRAATTSPWPAARS